MLRVITVPAWVLGEVLWSLWQVVSRTGGQVGQLVSGKSISSARWSFRTSADLTWSVDWPQAVRSEYHECPVAVDQLSVLKKCPWYFETSGQLQILFDDPGQPGEEKP